VSATQRLSCRVGQRRTLPRFLVLCSFFSLSISCRFIFVAPYYPNFVCKDTGKIARPPNQIPPRLEYRLSFAHGMGSLSGFKSWRFVICSFWFVFFRAHQLAPVMRACSQKGTRGTGGRKGGVGFYLSYLCALVFGFSPFSTVQSLSECQLLFADIPA
jgi:hypothetical protein